MYVPPKANSPQVTGTPGSLRLSGRMTEALASYVNPKTLKAKRIPRRILFAFLFVKKDVSDID